MEALLFVVQSLRHVWFCNSRDCSMPAFPVLYYLLGFAQIYIHRVNDAIKSVMPSNHLILCHPLLLPPSVFPSIRFFSNESVLRPNYWSFSSSITPSNEYSGLISFRIDWFDLLAVQGTQKNLLQHHSSKASILSVVSLLYGPTLISILDCWKKTVALTMWTSVRKVMSLFFNMLSRFATAFFPRKAWHFMAAVTVCSSARKENLSLLPLFPLLFAMKWYDWMLWS